MNVSEELIRQIVQKVILEAQVGKDEFEKHIDKSGVLSVKTDTVKTEEFGGVQGVSLKDIVTLQESPRMGAGIMELKDSANFEWTLTYDEFDMVIDGTLEIEINGSVVTGHKNDIIYIPKNSHIHFRTPDFARFAYFVYPADWQSQK